MKISNALLYAIAFALLSIVLLLLTKGLWENVTSSTVITSEASSLKLLVLIFTEYLLLSGLFISLAVDFKERFDYVKNLSEEGLAWMLVLGLFWGSAFGFIFGLIYGLIYGLGIGLTWGLLVWWLEDSSKFA